MVTNQHAHVVERALGWGYTNPPSANPTTTPGGSDRGFRSGLGTNGNRSAPPDKYNSWDEKSNRTFDQADDTPLTGNHDTQPTALTTEEAATLDEIGDSEPVGVLYSTCLASPKPRIQQGEWSRQKRKEA
jgi:hypothetical protein